MRSLSSQRRRLRPERGATAVEFALTVVILLTLFFGIVVFARAVWIYQAVSAASREAARYGISNAAVTPLVPRYLDCAGIRAAAKDKAPDVALVDADIVVAYVHPSGAAGTCAAPGPVVNGSRIKVTITRPMDLSIPLVPLSLDITGSDERSIYNGVDGP